MSRRNGRGCNNTSALLSHHGRAIHIPRRHKDIHISGRANRCVCGRDKHAFASPGAKGRHLTRSAIDLVSRAGSTHALSSNAVRRGLCTSFSGGLGTVTGRTHGRTIGVGNVRHSPRTTGACTARMTSLGRGCGGVVTGGPGRHGTVLVTGTGVGTGVRRRNLGPTVSGGRVGGVSSIRVRHTHRSINTDNHGSGIAFASGR